MALAIRASESVSPPPTDVALTYITGLLAPRGADNAAIAYRPRRGSSPWRSERETVTFGARGSGASFDCAGVLADGEVRNLDTFGCSNRQTCYTVSKAVAQSCRNGASRTRLTQPSSRPDHFCLARECCRRRAARRALVRTPGGSEIHELRMSKAREVSIGLDGGADQRVRRRRAKSWRRGCTRHSTARARFLAAHRAAGLARHRGTERRSQPAICRIHGRGAQVGFEVEPAARFRHAKRPRAKAELGGANAPDARQPPRIR